MPPRTPTPRRPARPTPRSETPGPTAPPRAAGSDGWPGFELAWTLARRWWGQGYATEGARAALAHAFTALEKDRVISLIHPENRASIRVAERIGETLKGRVNHLGREMLCYGLDRETYLREASEAVLLESPRWDPGERPASAPGV